MGPISPDAWQVLVRAAWTEDPVVDPSQELIDTAVVLAHRNEVAPLLVHAYADRLITEANALRAAVAAYHRNLVDACALLEDASVPTILIKALPMDEYIYSNFDLVVGEDGWDAAIAALDRWTTRTSAHPLERTKLLLYPAEGPAVHLHRSVAWFDVPVVATSELRARARRPDGSPCLLPCAADALQILVAHAAFQNLSLTLGELRTYRDLATAGNVAEAARLAREEGWARGFMHVTRAADRTIARLDALEPTALPAALPVLGSAAGGLEHAVHLARSGRLATALRELALRVPLIAAKRRAVYRAGRI